MITKNEFWPFEKENEKRKMESSKQTTFTRKEREGSISNSLYAEHGSQ